jgi:LysR family transcriptional regulator, transcriptional activator for dmlA
VIDLPDLKLFVAVADAGGITAAARALESSPPAVSRRLAALERRLAVRLVERSSHRFRLTDEGGLLYARARVILEQLRDAEAEVASRGRVARGLLRIGAPSEFGRRHIAPLVAQFAQRHPGLRVHLELSDVGLEAGEDAFDVVLRVGLPKELGLLARKLISSPCVVCAAPSYISLRGAPKNLDDLVRHECLLLARRERLIDTWTFIRDGRDHDVAVSGTISSGSGEALHTWACAGVGVSFEALWDVADDLNSGALINLFPKETPRPVELFATFSATQPLAPRIRLFVDFLVASFKR